MGRPLHTTPVLYRDIMETSHNIGTIYEASGLVTVGTPRARVLIGTNGTTDLDISSG